LRRFGFGVLLSVEPSALLRFFRLWASVYPAASSIFSYPEGRAALVAARRQGRLGEGEHAQALAAFEGLQADLVTVDVDRDLARRAGKHAEDLGLRGYDAVHLATALELGDEEVVVVTWDRDLARATEQVGLGLGGLS
jgi:predicted nucleic acid-binding protein